MRSVRNVLALGSLALLACNQTDPGSPSGSEDYFPLIDGARYEYLHSSSGWTELVEIEEGEDDTFLQHQSGDPDGESSISTFEIIDGDVLRVAEDQLIADELKYSVEYDPGFLRFSAAWATAEIGFEETRRYERTETEYVSSSGSAGSGGAGGSGGGGGSGGSGGGGSGGSDGEPVPETKDPQPRAHTFTVESVTETVRVPAGTFKNCLRVRRVRALDDPSIDDPTAQEEQDKLYWFAPGVGKIQEENVMTNNTEQLESYDLGDE